ncbi:MAG: peroxidase-related enzyme [Thermomicrobiales bacterium]
MTRAKIWTQDILQWSAWIPPVGDSEIDDAKRTVLDTFPTTGNTPYYRVLVHQPAILRSRTDLFNESLRGESGLPRADRELAATGSSRATGCVYCASVHARAYSQLTRDKSLIQLVLDDGIDAPIPDRERAIVQFSAHLALDPAGLSDHDVRPMREQGLSDAEILDVAHAAAIFANANRLMLTLGQGESAS